MSVDSLVAPQVARQNRVQAVAHSSRLGIREKLQQGIATGLHVTGSLAMLRRFEHTHRVFFKPGARWPRLERFNQPKFAILCYHRVGTGGVPLFSQLQPRVFDAQMRYLRKNYRVVPLGQLCDELRIGDPVKPTVAVTFDDGYRDLYTHALPVLRKYQIPATIYLIGKSMETGECPWYDRIFVALEYAPEGSIEIDMETSRRFFLTSPEARRKAAWDIVCYLRTLPDSERRDWCAAFNERTKPQQAALAGRMLDWNQVRSMQTAGVRFGAHTMTHPSVARVESSRLDQELNAARKLLEAGLDAPVDDFSYPFGKPADCLSSGDPFFRRCDFRSAVTTVAGINCPGSDRLRLNRLQIGDDPSLSAFAFNLARTFFEADSAPPMPSAGANLPEAPSTARREAL